MLLRVVVEIYDVSHSVFQRDNIASEKQRPAQQAVDIIHIIQIDFMFRKHVFFLSVARITGDSVVRGFVYSSIGIPAAMYSCRGSSTPKSLSTYTFCGKSGCVST